MVKTVGKYELYRTLGEGSFGKVKYAVNIETKEAVAIKILDKEKIQKNNMGAQIKKEISIMKLINHTNVVSVKDVFATTSKIFIVLELVDGGELFDKIQGQGRLTEEQARFYLRQLCDGLDHCHSRGVCHRDLKPEVSSLYIGWLCVGGGCYCGVVRAVVQAYRILFVFVVVQRLIGIVGSHSPSMCIVMLRCCCQNLLLDKNGDLKISDFGLSALYVGDADAEGNARSELLHTTCGTPNYVAPEVLENHGYDGKKADVWSIGVIVYVLLAGYLPFEENTMVQLFVKIKSADFEYPSWFSSGVKELLNRILIADPAQRLSLSEVRDHPWVTNGPAWSDEPASSSQSQQSSGGHTTVDGTGTSDIPPKPAASVAAVAAAAFPAAIAAPSSSQNKEVLMPPVPPPQPQSQPQSQSPSMPQSQPQSPPKDSVNVAASVSAKAAAPLVAPVKAPVETVPIPKPAPAIATKPQQPLPVPVPQKETKPATTTTQREAPVAGNASGGCGCVVA